MMTTGIEIARCVLFTRAVGRVCTSHPQFSGPSHGARRALVRVLGEVVSLLALVYVAEAAATRNPWTPLLGILFAFTLPTVVLTDGALAGACRALRLRHSPYAHAIAGLVGVFLCFVVYELFVHATGRALDDMSSP